MANDIPKNALRSSDDLVFDGPQDAFWTLALTHGAGQDIDSPFLTFFAQGVSHRKTSRGGVRVVRFAFPYMQAARTTGRKSPPDREPVLMERWRQIISHLEQEGVPGARLVIGGKSLGGRIASLIADEQKVAGLVCLGYPFHPPGQQQRLRIGHLKALRTPALICQGTRDPFGSRAEVAEYDLSSAIRLMWLEEGDHGYKPPRTSAYTEQGNWSAAMDAILEFLEGLAEM
jgi:hypothetical protein